jgi:hypothetical protein
MNIFNIKIPNDRTHIIKHHTAYNKKKIINWKIKIYYFFFNVAFRPEHYFNDNIIHRIIISSVFKKHSG